MNRLTRQPTESPDPLDTAAMAIYDLSKPGDAALPYDLLTVGQQDRYRLLATLAVRMTDVVAVRAALEQGASAIAAHRGVTLRDSESPARMSLRFDAMDCVRAFQDSLMHGTADTDERALVLEGEERQILINKLHARALAEDEAETRKRDARREILRYGGRSVPIGLAGEPPPPSGHDGELFGDGRR